MASNEILCGPCESEHSTNVAVIWCPNCEEGLCTQCSNYHRLFKATRQHKTISIGSFKNLPTYVRNSSQVCQYHDDTLELYCVVHQNPCCAECIMTKHSDCPGITSLKRVVCGMQESVFYQSIKTSVNEIVIFLEKLKENRVANLHRLQQQGVSLGAREKMTREEINKHLDKLEKALDLNIKCQVKSEADRITEIIGKIDSLLTEAREKQNNISTFAEFATNLQIFFGFKHLEKEIVMNTKQVAALLETTGAEESHIDLHISEEIERIIANIANLGVVKIYKEPLTLCFDETNLKSQFAPLSRKKYNTIQDIVLRNISSYKIPISELTKIEINICSCIILPDGKIVTSNNTNNSLNNGQLYVFNAEGDFGNTVPDIPSPFGMCLINSEEIAVSFHHEKSIKVFSSTDLTCKRTILSGHSNFGLSCFKEVIIIAIRDMGIAFLNSSYKICKTLPTGYTILNYVHLQGDRIYYTNFDDDVVYCIDTDGNDIWKCRFSKMKGPRNVCTDSYGNVFVAACDSNNVIVVSPDGTNCREILGSEDGIMEPKALCFDANRSCLVIANKDGTVFKYNLSYNKS